jgi:hypothetical protein
MHYYGLLILINGYYLIINLLLISYYSRERGTEPTYEVERCF